MKNNKIVSNTDLEILIDNHPNPMILSDINGRILAINDKLASIFGKKKGELVGTSGFKYIDAQVGKQRLRIIKDVIKYKKTIEVVDYERGRWWKSIFTPILENDNVVKLAYYIEDITDKKEIEINFEKSKYELEDISLKLATISENIDVGLYYTDVNGNFLWANKKVAEIAGRSREEMIGKNGKYLLDIGSISKKDYLKALKLLTFVKLGKKAGPETFKIKQKDGSEKLIEIKAQKINLHGEVVVVGIVKDITKLVKVEKSRDEYEKKFQMLSDQSLMGILIVQADNIVYVNDALSQITGYSKNEILEHGLNLLTDSIHPDEKSFVLDQLKKKLAGNKNVINRYKFRLFTKNGSIKWLDIYSKTIKFMGKNADFINLIDVTKEKNKEVDLEESKFKWDSLVNNIPESDRVIIVDKSRKIQYVNRTFPGRSKKDIIGNKYDDFLQGKSLNEMKYNLNLVFNEGKPRKYSTFYKSPDGLDHYFESIATPILREGKVDSALCIAIDNTKIREAEIKAKSNLNYMRKILNGTSEIIFTISPEKKITLWNKSAEKKIGFKQKLLTNKKINRLNIFENIEELQKFIEKTIIGQKINLPELIVNTKYGYKMVLATSITLIRDDVGKISDILFVCWDITKEKASYKNIKSGNSYLIFDKNINRSIDLINNYLTKDKRIFIISRNIDIITNEIIQKKKIDSSSFSTIKNNNNIIKNTDELINSISDYLAKYNESIIFIDRIDYLISLFSFEKVIQSLYIINDLIRKTKSTMIIRLNRELINNDQMLGFEQEFLELPTDLIEEIKIEENLYKILKFINGENQKNQLVNLQKIRTHFNISKTTVKNRIEFLIKKQLIFYEIEGRSKILYVSEKGKNLIKNKKFI